MIRALIFCLCVSAGSVVRAAEVTVYADSITQGGGSTWLTTSEAVGYDPCCGAVTCPQATLARNPRLDNGGGYSVLIANGFDTISLPANVRVDRISFDIHARYGLNSGPGKLQSKVKVYNGLGQLAYSDATWRKTPEFQTVEQCRWRYGNHDITSVVNWNSDLSLLDGIQIEVSRDQNVTMLGINAFRLVVEYSPCTTTPLAYPGSLDFGTLCTNEATTSQQSFTVDNPRNCDVTLGLSVPTPFSIVGSSSPTVTAGGSLLVTVNFDRQGLGAGPYGASLQVLPGSTMMVDAEVLDHAAYQDLYDMIMEYCVYDEFDQICYQMQENLQIGDPIVFTASLAQVGNPGVATRDLYINNTGPCPWDCSFSIVGDGFTLSPGPFPRTLQWLRGACPGQDQAVIQLCGGVTIPVIGTVTDNDGATAVVQATVEPSSPVNCGETSITTVSIVNTSSTCSIDGAVSLDNEPNFQLIQGGGPYSIEPGGVHQVLVEFDPLCGVGPPDTMANLTYFLGSTVPLVATTFFPSDVTVSPVTWQPAPVFANAPHLASQTFVVTNETIWLRDVSATLSPGLYFQATGLPANVNLAPGDSLSFVVEWNYPGGIELTDTGQIDLQSVSVSEASTIAVPLIAMAVDGDVRWESDLSPGIPYTYVDGFLGVARFSPLDPITDSIELCNDGPVSVTRNVSVVGSGFSLSSTGNVVVPAMGCISIDVTHSQTAGGWHTATIRATGPQETEVFEVSAYVGYYLTWPPALSFGNVVQGQPANAFLVLRAPNNAPLNLALSEDLCAPFQFLGPSNVALGAGGEITLPLTFSSTVADVHTSSLRFGGFSRIPVFANVLAPVAVEPQVPEATNVLSISVYPNPAPGQVTVGFGSGFSHGRQGKLEIFDLRGRRVASRTFESVQPGDLWEWDRRDTAGARVASGVYLVRVNVGAESALKRVLLR